MRAFPACVFAVSIALAAPPAAAAAAAEPHAETAIRDTLTRWYEELAKKDEGRLWILTAPGFIDATPHFRYAETRSAKPGPRIYSALAARALQFSWETVSIRADARFAKVHVWERGYFYAWATQRTYEAAHAATFILERQEKDGRWLVLAHESRSRGIPPNRITDPMPDLRALFYATEGRTRDPDEDARNVPKF